MKKEKNYRHMPKQSRNPSGDCAKHSNFGDSFRGWDYKETIAHSKRDHVTQNYVCWDCEVVFKKHIDMRHEAHKCPKCGDKMKNVGVITRIPRKGSSRFKALKKQYGE